ncbi:MAG: peptidoglycan LD-endopeptidase LytH [Micromonosporaceae bacterium]|nr:peptidoglycan LD-endopeptidase LytH [Micromonosporaceae bacterium]
MTVVGLAVASVLAGCGHAAARPASGSTRAAPYPVSTGAGAAPSVAPTGSPGGSASPAAAGYAFPVRGNASYARTHHDYPASDIMAACGSIVVATTSGVVLYVTTVDRYDPKVNAGATRGGLSISILGTDGVRYYGSHLSAIEATVAVGRPVTVGQPIGRVGRTGDAGACHLHYGISPPCAREGDWWNQRGVIWPWPYLDSWRSGGAKSPVSEITDWQAANGCPDRPLAEP